MSADDSPIKFVAGSFRDRGSRVFESHGQIFRAMTSVGWEDWQAVASRPCLQSLLSSGELIGTRSATLEEIAQSSRPSDIVGVLRHDRVPCITYPFEWPFGMLRAAALLQLDILRRVLDDGVILKDATPYNVQFIGTRPVFIDVGSFEPLQPGQLWSAYQQFCEMCLYPLMLQSYRGIEFQSLLRAELEGLSAQQARRLLRPRDLFKPGVWSHVWLQAVLSQMAKSQQRSTLQDLRHSGFSVDLIKRNVEGLRAIVSRLRWDPPQGQWVDYDKDSPMVARDADAKAQFVTELAQSRDWSVVWDLGCNRGRYALLTAPHAKSVLAMDRDQGCIELLYRQLVAEGPSNVIPLVMNVSNSSPGMGWRGRERLRLEQRCRPDLVLCLGLIHHLVISANIPLAEVIDWFAELGATLVLEFPTRQDPMVQALLRNKRDQYSDYSIENLVSELQQHFLIERQVTLPSGERVLFQCHRHQLTTNDQPGI